MSFLSRAAVAVLLCASTAALAGGIDVQVGNGDKITGTLAPATEIETFRVTCPLGAAISVKAKTAKRGPALRLVLRDPDGLSIGDQSGTAPAITATAGETGTFRVEVTSQNLVVTGDYALAITWKTPTKPPIAVTLPAGGDGPVQFAADAGAQFSSAGFKLVKGATARPVAVRIDGPDAYSRVLPAPKGTKVILPATGAYTLTVHDSGAAGGPVGGSITLKSPKSAKRSIALTAKAIGSGGLQGDRAFAAVVGTDGSTVVLPATGPGDPGAGLAGSSVTIPPGALGSPTAIIIATAPLLEPPGDLEGAGPTVFFGPEGLKFNTAATVTIPYDAAQSGQTVAIVVYTRDAKGKIKAVPGPYAFDTLQHTLTFSVSHFSSFRCAAPLPSVPFGDVQTLAVIADPRDVCIATDAEASATQRFLYVAEGDGMTLGAIHVTATVTGFERQLFAGGGNVTIDGTSRLQFRFTEAVIAVASASDAIYAATPTQIFRIDSATGAVTRFAGTGQSQDGGDGLEATLASFVEISDILVNEGSEVFVADIGAHKIRRIDFSSSLINAWAGTGSGALGADNVPLLQTSFIGPQSLSVAIPGPGLFVGDGGRVRLLDDDTLPVNVTIAGSAAGAVGSSGDNGPATSALFRNLGGIGFDIEPGTGGFAVIVCDAGAHTLRRVDLTTNTIKAVAGIADSPGFDGEGASHPTRLNQPVSVAGLAGVYYLCDRLNGRLRMILAETP